MNLNKKGIVGISLCAALALQALGDEKNSLGSVDVVSTDQEKTSYTVESMNTSTKLNLSIKETPQSVSVLTSQRLEDMGVTSYQDMLSYVTGVTLNRWDERLNASARGFVVDYYKIDGVPSYTEYNERDLDLSIYDRVEIVRGANGLTTGAGNPGVSINLVRKKADSKELKQDITMSTDSYGSYGVTADTRTKINEDGSLRARLITKIEQKKSFMDKYKKDNTLIYGVIDNDISDSTYLSLGASFQQNNRSGIRWGGLPAFYSDGSRTDFDRSLSVTEDWTHWNNDIRSVFANLQHNIDKDKTLNLAYSYEEIDSDMALLYFNGQLNKSDGSGLTYMDFEGEVEKKESNLDINLNTPFEMNGLEQEIVVGVTHNLAKQTKYDARYPQGYYSALPNFFNYDISLPAADSSTDVPYVVKPEQVDQKAAYLAGNFSLAKKLKLIAGTRVTNYEYSSDDHTKETRKFSGEFTPYLGLVYDINKQHSVYTSYTNIFKPQSYKDVNGAFLDPIEGNNYEAGIKGEYFDKALNASLSIFKIEQDNVGEAIDGVFVGGTQAYRAVEGVTSKGFELDISGQVKDNLDLNFGLANFEAEDRKGVKYNTKASRTTANLFAKYSLKNYSLGGGINYKSKYYTGSGASQITQDAYYIVNLMGSYDIAKDMSVQVNVENLLDKKYYEGIGSNGMTYGDPRNLSASLKYSF